MKQPINEIRRMQQLAGIITESYLNENLDNNNFRFDFLQQFLNKPYSGKYIVGYEDLGPNSIDIVLGKSKIPFDFSEGSSQKLGLDDIKMQQAGVIKFVKNPGEDNFSVSNVPDQDYEANVEILDALYTWINKNK